YVEHAIGVEEGEWSDTEAFVTRAGKIDDPAVLRRARLIDKADARVGSKKAGEQREQLRGFVVAADNDDPVSRHGRHLLQPCDRAVHRVGTWPGDVEQVACVKR